jgi:cyclopropane-fatty-acyl-phospholipid synthase
MKGGGYYDEHSAYQSKVAATATELIAESVAAVPLPPADQAFVVADYGASTGRNSIASIETAIAAIRRRRADQHVAVIHNDLPTNDWNQLFANVASAGEGAAGRDGSPVVPLASAISFFEPAAPASSVHLGLSFSAAHWLREQPDVVVPEGFYFCEATGEARAALARQADADWTSFLEARAIDLAPGGRLLVQTVGTETAPGHEPRVTARRLLRAMAEVARDQVEAGALSAAAVDRYVLPVVARTVDEALAPLERAGAPLAAAFDVVTCRTDPVANPYLEQWRQDASSESYARSYVEFVRGFTESSLRTHLLAPGTLEGSPEALLEDFYQRLERRFAADPMRDRFEDWTLTVLLERRAGARRRPRRA